MVAFKILQYPKNYVGMQVYGMSHSATISQIPRPSKAPEYISLYGEKARASGSIYSQTTTVATTRTTATIIKTTTTKLEICTGYLEDLEYF